MANTNVFSESRVFNSEISQIAKNNCNITCTNQFSGNTFIAKGVRGGILLSQSCQIMDSSCQMKSVFEADISTIMESIISQTASSKSVALLDGFGFNTNRTDIKSVVTNRITQLMMSSCVIDSSNTRNNNYFMFVDVSGGIKIQDSSVVTSSSCVIDNAAKASIANQTKVKSDQTAKTASALGDIFIALIAVAGVIVIVLLAFVFGGKKSGGAATGKAINVISTLKT
jgi:hypothetical protein